MKARSAETQLRRVRAARARARAPTQRRRASLRDVDAARVGIGPARHVAAREAGGDLADDGPPREAQYFMSPLAAPAVMPRARTAEAEDPQDLVYRISGG